MRKTFCEVVIRPIISDSVLPRLKFYPILNTVYSYEAEQIY